MPNPVEGPLEVYEDMVEVLLVLEIFLSHPLGLSGDSSVLMDLHWPCDRTAQYSILSISSLSVILL